jgi:hypothetical protein
VIFILWGLSGAALLALLPSQLDLIALGVASLVWLVLGAWALWGWLQSAVGRLQWDGEVWHWVRADVACVCHPTWVLDFQRVMLLLVRITPRGHLYVWLERPSPNDPSWNALRRAIAGSQHHVNSQGTKSASKTVEHGL